MNKVCIWILNCHTKNKCKFEAFWFVFKSFCYTIFTTFSKTIWWWRGNRKEPNAAFVSPNSLIHSFLHCSAAEGDRRGETERRRSSGRGDAGAEDAVPEHDQADAGSDQRLLRVPDAVPGEAAQQDPAPTGTRRPGLLGRGHRAHVRGQHECVQPGIQRFVFLLTP